MKTKIVLIAFATLFAKITDAQSWSITGNSGTSGSVNFVGTTDGQKLVFKTANTTRFIVGSNAGLTPGAIGINLDPDVSPYGGVMQLSGSASSGTAFDLVRSPLGGTGWDNQIRFYNYNNMRHLIADDYGTGKLVIQTNVDANSGSVDILDIRGRVEIGCFPNITTPAGYRLYVADGILTEKVKVALKNSSDWADYVFKKDYKLMPFANLQKYVNTHGHLPGIPSANEVVKNGIDLGKMDAKLLEKIEELTLYILQLNQENLELKKQINTLNRKIDEAELLDQKLKNLQEQVMQLQSILQK